MGQPYRKIPGGGVKRSRIIMVAVTLAILGAALPMGAMFWVSWMRAVHEEQQSLVAVADRAITRARLSLDEVRNALHAAEIMEHPPCSTEHIARMRALTLQTHAIEQMGYFEDGLLKCTTWGPMVPMSPEYASYFTIADGLRLAVGVRPMVSPDSPMISVGRGAHWVLINPMRFVDAILEPDVRMAMAIEPGILLSTLHAPNPSLIQRLLARNGNGLDGGSLFVTVRASGLIAIVTEPEEKLKHRIWREALVFQSIGIVIAGFVVAIVVWLSRRRLSPLGELTVAVQKREFIAHYQPLVELSTGRCIGAEALVRWQRPDGSLVRPDFFIPLAEESGLILPITDQVIEAVMADLGQFLREDRSLHIAINLSAEDVKTGRFLPVLQAAMERQGIQPEQIWLEATERGFMDVEASRSTITRMRALGHAVAIDDFGTGYSSLSYLQDFPLDALKIDKSFVDTLGTSSATSSVTPHIIDMAKTLDLKIVAEGVETRHQLDYLLERKVDFGQGWLFSKPLPAGDFIAYCRAGQAALPQPLPA